MRIKLNKQQQAEWDRALKAYQQALLLEAAIELGHIATPKGKEAQDETKN